MKCGEFFEEAFFEFGNFTLFDGESGSLSVSAISDKEILGTIEELYHIAPIRGATRGNGSSSCYCFLVSCPPSQGDIQIRVPLPPLTGGFQSTSLRGYRSIINIYFISLSSRKWMIVSIFDDDARFSIHLCELACNQTDDAMFQIGCIIK